MIVRTSDSNSEHTCVQELLTRAGRHLWEIAEGFVADRGQHLEERSPRLILLVDENLLVLDWRHSTMPTLCDRGCVTEIACTTKFR